MPVYDSCLVFLINIYLVSLLYLFEFLFTACFPMYCTQPVCYHALFHWILLLLLPLNCSALDYIYVVLVTNPITHRLEDPVVIVSSSASIPSRTVFCLSDVVVLGCRVFSASSFNSWNWGLTQKWSKLIIVTIRHFLFVGSTLRSQAEAVSPY